MAVQANADTLTLRFILAQRMTIALAQFVALDMPPTTVTGRYSIFVQLRKIVHKQDINAS
jgi:hypothetical protein